MWSSRSAKGGDLVGFDCNRLEQLSAVYSASESFNDAVADWDDTKMEKVELVEPRGEDVKVSNSERRVAGYLGRRDGKSLCDIGWTSGIGSVADSDGRAVWRIELLKIARKAKDRLEQSSSVVIEDDES